MVALQWVGLKHEANDLQPFFTDELYGKIAELSCIGNSIPPSPLSTSKLWGGVKTACALLTQLVAMEIR